MKRVILLMTIAIIFTNCEKEKEVSSELKKEKISFVSSANDINITADTYIKETNSEFVLLCHQAGFSRGEYIDIAPKLASKGYNCMAIDQRSGGKVNGIHNETHNRASEKGLNTDFLSAKSDIITAIDKAYALNGNKPIYLLGSSYSSSWALILGKTNSKVKAAIAYSPRENLSGHNITNELQGYEKPVYATSALSETSTTASLVSKIETQYLTHFKSTKAGIHGASCLWDSTEGYEEYWTSLIAFMDQN